MRLFSVLLRGSRGVTGDGHAFTRFLSLPYADPPIGQRRFARPEPARGNAATVDATRSPPMCLQPRLATADRVVMIGDENCLVLNVYTPGKRVLIGHSMDARCSVSEEVTSEQWHRQL